MQTSTAQTVNPAREALPQAAAALDAAERQGQPQGICRALTDVARCYIALGALNAAEDNLRQALAQACRLQAIELQVSLLCELAEIACTLADAPPDDDADAARAARERARDQAFEVTLRACRIAAPARQAEALLRAADVLVRCGDRDDAAAIATRARVLQRQDAPRP